MMQGKEERLGERNGDEGGDSGEPNEDFHRHKQTKRFGLEERSGPQR